MKDMLIVKVEKCGDDSWWYDKLIGLELNVLPYDNMNYCLYGNPILLVAKSDVKVVGKI